MRKNWYYVIFLISWWNSRWDANSSSVSAVIYNRSRDFFMLLIFRFLIIFNFKFKIFRFLLIFFATFRKSSLFLFNFWLPIAIEGPTPVSSLLHSSTIVIARIIIFRFLIFNFNFYIFNIFIFLRIFTCIISRFLAFGWLDLKKIIAFSTTSQLRLIIFIINFCNFSIRIFHIIFHAF